MCVRFRKLVHSSRGIAVTAAQPGSYWVVSLIASSSIIENELDIIVTPLSTASLVPLVVLTLPSVVVPLVVLTLP